MLQNLIVSFSLIIASTYFFYQELLLAKSLNLLEQSKSKISLIFEPATSWEKSKRETEIIETFKNLKILSDKNNLLHLAHHEAARGNLILAIRSSDSKDSLDKFCSARSLFLRASQVNPLNPTFHIGIADIESLSPGLSESCDSEIKDSNINTNYKLNVKERLEYTLNIAPIDLLTIYRSAIIYNFIGERELALTSYRRYQELSVFTPWNIREQLVTIPNNTFELSLITPKKYPEIIHWINTFKKNRTSEFNHYLPEFQNTVLEIIDQELNKLKNSTIDASTFISMLENLAVHEVSTTAPKIHRRIHSILAEYYESKNNIFGAKISGLFANSNRLPVAKSSSFSRKSPSSGMIFAWHPDLSERIIQLNLKADHIGFFVNKPELISHLIISGDRGQSIPDSLKIKIWTSNDNISFSPYRGEIKYDKGIILGRPIIYIVPSQTLGRFNKIYFEAPQTLGGLISTRSRDLIQVYSPKEDNDE